MNGRMSGKGSYTNADGSSYVGEWQDDRQHGIGKEIYPDGKSYVG